MEVNIENEGTQIQSSIEQMEEAKSYRIRGELPIAIMSLIWGCLGYYFAMDMTQEAYSSPAVFPKLTSLIIIIFSVFQIYKCTKKQYRSFGIGAIRYILPRNVLFTLSLLIMSCIIMPFLHFLPVSFLFMSILMIYLDNREHIVRSILISAVATGTLMGIFRYIFSILLP